VPRNVGCKARARDWDGQLRLAAEIARVHRVVEQQEVFYAVARGRLKLRTVRDATGTRLAAAVMLYAGPTGPVPSHPTTMS
jgi:hypothetical protein